MILRRRQRRANHASPRAIAPRLALLALLTLVIQWAAPGLHALQIAHAAAHPALARCHAGHSSTPSEQPRPVHHDEANCTLCLSIAQSREGAVPAPAPVALEVASVQWAEPLPEFRAAPSRPVADARPRAPPAPQRA